MKVYILTEAELTQRDEAQKKICATHAGITAGIYGKILRADSPAKPKFVEVPEQTKIVDIAIVKYPSVYNGGDIRRFAFVEGFTDCLTKLNLG